MALSLSMSSVHNSINTKSKPPITGGFWSDLGSTTETRFFADPQRGQFLVLHLDHLHDFRAVGSE